MLPSLRLFASLFALLGVVSLASCALDDLAPQEEEAELGDDLEIHQVPDGQPTRTTAGLWNEDLPSDATCRSECDGEFGPHGVNGESFCLCRTEDVGTRCTADRDCQGSCLFEEFEVVESDLGVAVGACSEFETTFGCHERIPDWLADLGPQPLPFNVPAMCID